MWLILEPALMIIVGIIIFTQIVLPPFIGRNFFWFFRGSHRRIHSKETELASLRDESKIAELNSKLRKEKDKINSEMIRR